MGVGEGGGFGVVLQVFVCYQVVEYDLGGGCCGCVVGFVCYDYVGCDGFWIDLVGQVVVDVVDVVDWFVCVVGEVDVVGVDVDVVVVGVFVVEMYVVVVVQLVCGVVVDGWCVECQ